MRSLLLLLLVVACAPARTTFVRYPGSPATFDPSASDPKAVAIAQKVFAAAGGPGHWDHAKQLRWSQTVTSNGQTAADGEEAWDRWNARFWGLLHRTDSDVAVGYELYGTFAMGYAQQGKHKSPLGASDLAQALGVAKAHYDRDTAVLALQFLMLDPGAKLTYVGPAADVPNADDIQVAFADPLRREFEFHAIVDRTSNLIARVELKKPGTNEMIGYSLADWVTVDGLKFASTRTDLGSSDKVAIHDVQVSAPDDDLFIAPMAQ